MSECVREHTEESQSDTSWYVVAVARGRPLESLGNWDSAAGSPVQNVSTDSETDTMAPPARAGRPGAVATLAQRVPFGRRPKGRGEFERRRVRCRSERKRQIFWEERRVWSEGWRAGSRLQLVMPSRPPSMLAVAAAAFVGLAQPLGCMAVNKARDLSTVSQSALKLWVTVDARVDVDGGRVAQWNDISHGENHAKQNSAGKPQFPALHRAAAAAAGTRPF